MRILYQTQYREFWIASLHDTTHDTRRVKEPYIQETIWWRRRMLRDGIMASENATLWNDSVKRNQSEIVYGDSDTILQDHLRERHGSLGRWVAMEALKLQQREAPYIFYTGRKHWSIHLRSSIQVLPGCTLVCIVYGEYETEVGLHRISTEIDGEQCNQRKWKSF